MLKNAFFTTMQNNAKFSQHIMIIDSSVSFLRSVKWFDHSFVLIFSQAFWSMVWIKDYWSIIQ
jgi:hypothetical protein